MDSITLTFPNPLNVSVQIGDIAYFTDSENVYEGEVLQKIGKITAITQGLNRIVCEIPAKQARPTPLSFILFTKDNTSNTGSLLGYFAKIQFRNGSTEESEVFSIGSEIFESSK
tara:strand:+ start:51 stop:392 length:342 start_codon:yes stop_codon:yes gene_type:complete